MKIKYFYTAISLALIIFLSLAANSGENGKSNETNKYIIKFSHAVHTEATDCASCHDKVSESTSLDNRLLPEKSVCATCHDVEDMNNCSQCHYGEKYEPLVQSKSELIFNHKNHVTDQKMECTSCHMGLEEVAYSFESATLSPQMNTCYSCHNNTTVAANNCETCHISTVNLIPKDHQEVGFFKSHKFNAEAMNADCEMCHDNSFCESCHASTTMINEKNTARDFYVPYSPHKLTDNAKQQQLTRVHDLNFRYTHGIEATNKTTECKTCHQTETFCVECHSSSGGDFALEGAVPSSHRKPNFVTIGVGSGGGQHALLAKRDIESCSACHDVQGADANCILCHNDSDGVKGTNPKTHISGFMKDLEDGDWHSDRGSVCYSCHTDANAHPHGVKKVGFCGYCHQ